MSRRGRKTLSPSLFPFLAVLVCTLGTLILLLALVAQNATGAAEQNAREKQVAQAKLEAAEAAPKQRRLLATSVDELIEEEKFRVAQLVAFRDQQTAEMGERRDTMTHLDDHIERLREELQRLSDEVDRAMDETQEPEADEETLIKIRAKITAEEEQIAKLKSEIGSASPRVVIVPHKGPNGTARRPIYLECTSDGLFIRPEGTRVTIPQLENSTRSANPLDAALRVVRMHAMRTYGDTSPPYPLLVVRPDGIETYGAARKAMRDWDDQFGYELVPDGIELAYSQPDDNLRERIETAVRETSLRQRALMANSIGGGNGSGSGLVRGGANGGRATGSNERFPTLSAAALDRAGRTNGFRSHEGDYTLPGANYADQQSQSSSRRRRNGTSYSASNAAGTGAGTPPSDLPIDQWEDEMRVAARELRGADGNTGEVTEMLSGESASQSNSTGKGDQPPSTDQASNDRQSSSDGRASTAGGSRSTGSQSSPSPQQQAGPNSSSNQSNSEAASQTAMDVSPKREMVRRRGADWALPDHMAGRSGNSIVRTIRVECFEDRFVLLPPGQGGATQMFGFSDNNIDRASLELATAVRDRIDQWGAALPGGKWQPTLDVQVAPGGVTRFYQLQKLMQDSGIEVTGRAAQ